MTRHCLFHDWLAAHHRVVVKVAHAAFDRVAVAVIYFDAESAVAHFFFR